MMMDLEERTEIRKQALSQLEKRAQQGKEDSSGTDFSGTLDQMRSFTKSLNDRPWTGDIFDTQNEQSEEAARNAAMLGARLGWAAKNPLLGSTPFGNNPQEFLTNISQAREQQNILPRHRRQMRDFINQNMNREKLFSGDLLGGNTRQNRGNTGIADLYGSVRGALPYPLRSLTPGTSTVSDFLTGLRPQNQTQALNQTVE